MFIKYIRKESKEEYKNAYWNSIPAIRNLGELHIDKNIIFLVGENGSGKSTLLEAIAVRFGFNPEGGSQNFNFSSKDSHSGLYSELVLGKLFKPKDGYFLRAESFYNMATEIENLSTYGLDIPQNYINQFGGKSLHDQSHGESFISLILNRFRGNGLYILDEPESALSPTMQMTLLVAIRNLIKDNSQFIIATHSPILMAYPNADIYQLSEDGMEKIEYKDTDHYIITKGFLNNPEGMIENLFK